MQFNSVSSLVRESNNNAIKNSDTIFINKTNQTIYTKGRLVGKAHTAIRYLCDKIIKLDVKLPDFCRSTKIIEKIKTYLDQHTPANHVLATRYKIPTGSNKLLTGKEFKEVIVINKLKENRIIYDVDSLSLTFDKYNVESVNLHLRSLIKHEAPICHIENDLNLVDKDVKNKLFDSTSDYKYLLADTLDDFNNQIEKAGGKISQWQKDIIDLLIKHGAKLTDALYSHCSSISIAFKKNYQPVLISHLIGHASPDTFNLQKNELCSALYDAIFYAKEEADKADKADYDYKYIPILKKIIDKGVNLELPIKKLGSNKANKQLIDSLLSRI
jgi:hypothetical protein